MNSPIARCFPFPAILVVVALAGCGGASSESVGDAGDPVDPEPPPAPTSSLPTVGATEKLESMDAGDAHSARIALDDRSSPTVFVTWNQNDGTADHLYLTRYAASNGFWDTPQRLDSEAGDVGPGEMVVDDKGRVTVAWPQEVNGRYRLWATYYNVFDSRWRDAEMIDGGDSGTVGQPRMVMESANSYTVVVWPQIDGVAGRLWANRYIIDLDGSWEGATVIDADSGNVAEVEMVIDGNDTATVIWAQGDGSRYNLWARRHDAASGWGVETKLDSEDLGDVSEPQVVVDGDGNITVIWLQNNGSVDRLWSARYTTAGWSGAEVISASGNVVTPKVVVDSGGDVVASWVEQSGLWNDVWARRFVRSGSGGSWQNSQQISSLDDGSAALAQLVVGPGDDIIALWRESAGGYFDLWASRYSPASGWGGAGKIEALDEGDAKLPVAAIDAATGDITAVWRQRHEGGDHLLTSQYSASADQWGEVYKVEAATESGGDSPLVVVDRSGRATAVWQQPSQEGRSDLWGNRY